MGPAQVQEQTTRTGLQSDIDSTEADLTRQSRLVTADSSELLEIGFLLAKATPKNCTNYDWAIIQITSDDFSISNAMSGLSAHKGYPTRDGSTLSNGVQIVTSIGSKGAVNGELLGSSIFLRVEGSQFFEEVEIVELRGALG